MDIWTYLIAAGGAAFVVFAALVARRRRPRPAPPAAPGLPPARPFASLQPGKRYSVIRAWEDYDRQVHDVGETWTFLTYAFLPYEDGLSWFVSRETGVTRHIRIQWRPEAGQQYEVANDPSQFMQEV